LDTGYVGHYNVFQNRHTSTFHRCKMYSIHRAIIWTKESHMVVSVTRLYGRFPTLSKIMLPTITSQGERERVASVTEISSRGRCWKRWKN
jgi:hypothetical protein